MSAHKLPSLLDIAQRDMLAVPAHALKKHTIMHTLLLWAIHAMCLVPGQYKVLCPSGAWPSSER